MAKKKGIDDYKADYAAAGKITDPAKRKAAQDAAHAGAEAIRARQGYSGGVDGSQHISLNTPAPKPAGNTPSKGGGGNSGSGNSGGGNSGVSSSDLSSIIQQMQKNSAAWAGADRATRNSLQQENQRLGASVGATYNPTTGKWSDNKGNDLYTGKAPTMSTPSGTPGNATPVRSINVFLPYQDSLGGTQYTMATGYIGSDNRTYLQDGSRIPDQAIVQGAGGKNWQMMNGAGVEYTGDLPGLTGATDQTNQQFLDMKKLLQGMDLLEYPEEVFEMPRIKTLTQDQAIAAAKELLQPQYEQSIRKTNQQMAELAAKRGVYDSPMSVGLTGDALADLESEYNQQINDLARNLMDKDYAQAQQTLQNAMQVWQMNQATRQNAYNAKYQQAQTKLSGMSGLLGSMMQNEQNYTSNFGVTPSGRQTLQGRAADVDIASTLAALTGKINGLEGYGISDGTPIYTPPSSGGGSGMSAAMAKFLAEQQDADAEEEEQAVFSEKVNGLIKKYGMLPSEAQIAASFLMDASSYGITDPTRVYSYWTSERPAFKQTGADLDAVERAILKEVGYVAPSTGKPKINSSGNGIQKNQNVPGYWIY